MKISGLERLGNMPRPLVISDVDRFDNMPWLLVISGVERFHNFSSQLSDSDPPPLPTSLVVFQKYFFLLDANLWLICLMGALVPSAPTTPSPLSLHQHVRGWWRAPGKEQQISAMSH